MSSLDIAPRSGSCSGRSIEARAERGTGFSCPSGGWELASSGDWASNNPVFAISRGPPSTPSPTT